MPQYIVFVLTGALVSDITSIGCHTGLWNFNERDYHYWVYKEGIDTKLAPLISCTDIAGTTADGIPVGCGLHDSSAALIPYFAAFRESFIMLSTGTWNISINPFNHSALTMDELSRDCLCYLSYEGLPVRAARLFAGYEHEQQVKRIAGHFRIDKDYCKTISYDVTICKKLQPASIQSGNSAHTAMTEASVFSTRNLRDFETAEEAYHQLMFDIIQQQIGSTKLVMHDTPVRKLFVDGGFSKNDIYLHLLAAAFPGIEVYSANAAQASAAGAAIAIKKAWNDNVLPSELISVKQYHATSGNVIGM